MPIEYFLVLAAALFLVGLAIVITKKNAIVVLMGVELMLNAANINLVSFAYFDPILMQGHFLALFVMVVAAAEAAVGLAIIIKVYQYFKTSDLDKITELKG
ncbi:MAG: NADH-quinone oxidoreductase subunit NuoK [Cyclobacteriaceae bacterium]|nr:NADH-quinone oxidoreductase subunit NuoK [Cyclobacteriaceae bacterium]MCH8515825.1 NADH-quinone oxidoreductase subunit NuoK [Cyclobacteriaceae bacterium]